MHTSQFMTFIFPVSLFASMVLTGVLVVIRMGPWTPTVYSNTALNVVASADDRTVAAQLIKNTAPDSVFVTSRKPDDPVLTIAGRTTIMGYYGH